MNSAQEGTRRKVMKLLWKILWGNGNLLKIMLGYEVCTYCVLVIDHVLLMLVDQHPTSFKDSSQYAQVCISYFNKSQKSACMSGFLLFAIKIYLNTNNASDCSGCFCAYGLCMKPNVHTWNGHGIIAQPDAGL